MPPRCVKVRSMPDWSWKLRFFASADLVGSTAYKQSKSGSTQEWARTFKEFFRSFPETVAAAYSRVPDKCPKCNERLLPWKFSGDEILFNAQLLNHHEVLSHLAAFKSAVREFPIEWEKKGVPQQSPGSHRHKCDIRQGLTRRVASVESGAAKRWGPTRTKVFRNSSENRLVKWHGLARVTFLCTRWPS